MLRALVPAVLLLVACGNDDDAEPTQTTTAESGAEWTYRTLDGDTIVIEDRGENPTFSGGVPTPVLTIDQAAEVTGCVGVQLELDHWLGTVDDQEFPDLAQRASAYAQYALDVGEERGCNLTR